MNVSELKEFNLNFQQTYDKKFNDSLIGETQSKHQWKIFLLIR